MRVNGNEGDSDMGGESDEDEPSSASDPSFADKEDMQNEGSDGEQEMPARKSASRLVASKAALKTSTKPPPKRNPSSKSQSARPPPAKRRKEAFIADDDDDDEPESEEDADDDFEANLDEEEEEVSEYEDEELPVARPARRPQARSLPISDDEANVRRGLRKRAPVRYAEEEDDGKDEELVTANGAGSSHAKRQKSLPSRRTKKTAASDDSLDGSLSSSASEPDVEEGDDDEDEDFGRPRRTAKGRLKAAIVKVRQSADKARQRAQSQKPAKARASSRASRKIYTEDESDEDESSESGDEDAKPVVAMPEEQGDCVEKVLTHQPIGTAACKKSAGEEWRPKADHRTGDEDEDGPIDWNQREFWVKWRSYSHIHNSWDSLATLSQLGGIKRVQNYMKRVGEERYDRIHLTREEKEMLDVSHEMELELVAQHVEVLSFDGKNNTAEEAVNDIAFAQQAIDEFQAREEECKGTATKSAMAARQTVVNSSQRGAMQFTPLKTQPEWLKGGELRDYQLLGLNWLANCWVLHRSCILADEMGTGKTVQSVAMLGYLLQVAQLPGPFLVVVPLSTVTNWVKEMKRWLPALNFIVYVGDTKSRETIRDYEIYTGRKKGRMYKFHALVTTYELVLKDQNFLGDINWVYLAVDEAHRLKNHESALYVALQNFKTESRLLITGTPLQNSLKELWALLHFLEPSKFASMEEFEAKYDTEDADKIAALHTDLKPHLLRRAIKDVEKSLPPKTERILRVGMSPLQKQYYKWILERNFDNLNKGVKGSGQLSLLNVVMELKKCCNHPFLFERAEASYGQGLSNGHAQSVVERISLASGKTALLDKLLCRLKETGHRVLIFSQMVKMLDILSDYLRLKGWQHQRLDGSTRADLRHQAMEHFNAPGSEDFCFLLSTRAGGLGINLATADTVIILDSDWNPQNDLQAMSRAHRIGQKDVVNIYRFVTSESVEEDIIERAKQKMVLDHLVIQRMDTSGRTVLASQGANNAGRKMFNKDELASILRFGAEKLFADPEADAANASGTGKALENMDIDDILARAESVNTTDEASGDLLNAFKVADFRQNEEDTLFWSRLIKPENRGAHQDELVPRERTVKSYAEDAMFRANQADDNSDKEKGQKSGTRSRQPQGSLPAVEGAVARVTSWRGATLSKRDAAAFIKAVRKWGEQSRLDAIAAETSQELDEAPPAERVELYRSLVNACEQALQQAGEDAKGPTVDFFGVAVKAADLSTRIKELTVLGSIVRRYRAPVVQFRLLSNVRAPTWAKVASWTPVDDAMLLLGVHYHGFGSWEAIRNDPSLKLKSKVAPPGVGPHETALPRASQLETRAAALLKKERERELGTSAKQAPVKRADKLAKGQKTIKSMFIPLQLDRPGSGAKRQEPADKKDQPPEEGEIVEAGGAPRSREAMPAGPSGKHSTQWQDWCKKELDPEMKTLKKLRQLQDAPDMDRKEMAARIRKYLLRLGQRIDSILQAHQSKDPKRTGDKLWNYVSNYSAMDGARLASIYAKLQATAAERVKEANDQRVQSGQTATTSAPADEVAQPAEERGRDTLDRKDRRDSEGRRREDDRDHRRRSPRGDTRRDAPPEANDKSPPENRHRRRNSGDREHRWREKDPRQHHARHFPVHPETYSAIPAALRPDGPGYAPPPMPPPGGPMWYGPPDQPYAEGLYPPEPGWFPHPGGVPHPPWGPERHGRGPPTREDRRYGREEYYHEDPRAWAGDFRDPRAGPPPHPPPPYEGSLPPPHQFDAGPPGRPHSSSGRPHGGGWQGNRDRPLSGHGLDSRPGEEAQGRRPTPST
eukprot:jgi/Chlat1/8937/Chrsp94S08325